MISSVQKNITLGGFPQLRGSIESRDRLQTDGQLYIKITEQDDEDNDELNDEDVIIQSQLVEKANLNAAHI